MYTDVAVYMLAYNHEKWIQKAIDGIIQQETSYSFKLYIHDDASTDGTRAIIEEYAQKYPDIIVPILQEENQYSKNIPITKTFIFPRLECKYVMSCEGDDYWIDSHKIQKQVDYMQQHPDCTFGFSDAYFSDLSGTITAGFYDTPRWNNPKIQKKMRSGEGCDLSTEEMLLLDFMPTATSVSRYEAFKVLCTEYPTTLDLLIRIVCTNEGYARYFNEKFTVYRTGNVNSASGSISGNQEKFRKGYYDYHRELLLYFNDHVGGKYTETIVHVLNRKDLESYLSFSPMSQLRKHSAYPELAVKFRTKLFLRKNFGKAYQSLKRVKVTVQNKFRNTENK